MAEDKSRAEDKDRADDMDRAGATDLIGRARLSQPTEPFRNIRLTLEFDGTAYQGWQVQAAGLTVQGELEEAILQVTGERLRVTGCSRTDAGVHARNFTANFYTASSIPSDRFHYPLNNVLPPDIRVNKSEETTLAFHSQRSALAKTYTYRFVNGDHSPAIGRQYVALVKGRLDHELMQEAAKLFQGSHDFRAFMSLGSSAKTTVRTIHAAALFKDGPLYELRLTGDGFLYNMVRIIAGTLIQLGHGSRSLQDLKDALAEGDRLKAGKVAQARGLILEDVYYGEEELAKALRTELQGRPLRQP